MGRTLAERARLRATLERRGLAWQPKAVTLGALAVALVRRSDRSAWFAIGAVAADLEHLWTTLLRRAIVHLLAPADAQQARAAAGSAPAERPQRGI